MNIFHILAYYKADNSHLSAYNTQINIEGRQYYCIGYMLCIDFDN